jgi:gamma-glutamyl:cysteine ligase YbdK (ATP-grasp superfamily)
MGRIFEPLTVGYDWEMAILRASGENVTEKDVELLSDDLRRKLPWAAPGTDLELIESRIGAVGSIPELIKKSERLERELRALLKKKGWFLLRSGARPFEREPVGAHIHVGTIGEWAGAIRIQNAMVPYAAPLAALMANSPVYRGRAGEYKSYRVASNAEWCSAPQPLLSPMFSRAEWGRDVDVKTAWGATVELRVGDGVSSTRLMCELVALSAGLMYHLSEHELDREMAEKDYRAMMVNRWRATKYGLQAVFRWNGEELPVRTLLTRMVDMAQDGMELLDFDKSDLRIIRSMIAKGQTQADFQLAVFAKEKGDAHRYTRALANIQRDPAAFEKYLRRAPVLSDVAPASHRDELLSRIEVETPHTDLFRATPLSPAQLDAVLAGFAADGLIREGRDSRGLRTYTRVR